MLIFRVVKKDYAKEKNKLAYNQTYTMRICKSMLVESSAVSSQDSRLQSMEQTAVGGQYPLMDRLYFGGAMLALR
ncbi:MAG: hypothetical protein ABTQ73_10695, partial [Caldilineales bacterium]